MLKVRLLLCYSSKMLGSWSFLPDDTCSADSGIDSLALDAIIHPKRFELFAATFCLYRSTLSYRSGL